MAATSNEDNAVAIVFSCVYEMLGSMIKSTVINALSERIVACLAEVELIVDDESSTVSGR